MRNLKNKLKLAKFNFRCGPEKQLQPTAFNLRWEPGTQLQPAVLNLRYKTWKTNWYQQYIILDAKPKKESETSNI